jgi:hypothetical protein
MVAYAKDGQFIDDATEVITVEVITYNAELNSKKPHSLLADKCHL